VPTFYFDSSALLKKYKTERGTDVINEVFDDRRTNEEFVTSYLTLIECYGTFRRLYSNHEISQALFQTYLGDIVRDLTNSFAIYSLFDDIANNAADQARDYGLRSADAIQLSTAVYARDQGFPQPIYFLSSDRRLNNVSAQLGFTVLNPEDQDALARLRSYRP
jgi:predicted nucleic acid-binding protein